LASGSILLACGSGTPTGTGPGSGGSGTSGGSGGGAGGSGGGAGGGGAGGGGAPSAALEQLFPIDGVVDFSVFDTVFQRSVEIFPFSGSAPVRTAALRWGILNDDRDVYFGIEWDDPTLNNAFDASLGPTDIDAVQLRFDGDGDGVLLPGDDQRSLVAATIASQYVDQHRPDTDDLVGDGFGRLKYDAALGRYRAEFLIPMTPDVRGEDAALSPGVRYDIVLLDHVSGAGGNQGSAFGTAADASTWPFLPLVAAGSFQRPSLPAGLTGLIAFVSTHEEPNGELYTFDPATRTVTRVTHLPALFKDNVSLSHDRTRLAFHGAPSRAALAQYEIYTVNVDGSNLQQLTRNGILDGHPAWSPDDSRLAYASFREAGKASIVEMTAAGVEIADLTPPGADDNDPDYLRDGRIVFKTDRFQPAPQVQIAVMDEDGTNVRQLTRLAGVSDHDPVGSGAFALLERFTKGTDFSTDPEALFSAWNLVRVALDGSGETTLLSDGWINWLPVFDPTAQFIVHLKTTGFTSAYLMSAGGTELGRLIPEITRITYIDWK